MQPKTKRLENRKQSTVTTTPTAQLHFSQQRQKRNQRQPKPKPQPQPQPQQPVSLFPVGSEIEISSDEEGLRGAWYVASVINPPPLSPSSNKQQQQQQQQQEKLYVEYKNLLSDEKGSALLKEFVDIALVRPKPPLDIKDELPFQVNDVVDAFFQDGWWTGVVTEVVSAADSNHKNRRYRVSFSDPPGDMEFRQSDLRVHRNWVYGKWVLPDKQRMGELNFTLGTAVEVSIDSDNSEDIWVPATFIEKDSNGSFWVEYYCSREIRSVKVAVDSCHIRPSPPRSSRKAFSLLEKVDAFYDNRWLSGIVTKILADGRYIVYFKRTKKEKELCHTDVRQHMEWTKGRWVHPSQDNSLSSNSEKLDRVMNSGYKEKICMPPVHTGIVKDNVGKEPLSTVTMKSCEKVMQTSGSEDANHDGTMPSNERSKQTNVNGDSICLKPSNCLIEKAGSDVAPSPEPCKVKMKQAEGSNNVTQADVDTMTPSNPAKSSSKQSEDSNQPSASTENQGNDKKHSSRRKRGRPRKLQTFVPDAVNETPNTSDVVYPYEPIVIGLMHNGNMIPSSSRSLGECMKEKPKKAVEDEKKHSDTSADHESEVNNGNEPQRESEVTNLKRKRGRSPKMLFLDGNPKSKEAEFVEVSKDAVSDAKDTPERHSPTDEMEKASAEVEKPVAIVEPIEISDLTPSSGSCRRHVRLLNQIKNLNTRSTARRTFVKRRKILKEIVEDKEDINEPVRHIMMRRGKQQRYRKQSLPLAEDRTDAVDESRDGVAEVFDNGVAKDVETVVTGTSSNVSDDDKPLSSWLEGPHSPSTTDRRMPDETGGKRDKGKKQPVDQPKEKAQEREDVEAPVEYANQDDNASHRLDETPMESTASVLQNNVDLPFVKNSGIWKMIESMEVFKRIPQNPHFRPLYNCKEECREGLAIGNMVTFTSLVERVSRFKLSNPRSLLDGYLEALIDLEEMGFNVGPVRDQLNTLLAIKSRHDLARNTYEEFEKQIAEQNLEKSKMGEEIVELEKKIAELDEKRRLVMSKKEMKDLEIGLLQSSVDTVKESLESARQEFEKVTVTAALVTVLTTI